MARSPLHALRFNKLILDLRNLSGRDLVIVGASLLDAALQQALSRRFAKLSSRDEQKIFFEESGAASRLSSKIDLALALGLITKETHVEAHRLRRLRNFLAHSLDPEAVSSDECVTATSAFAYIDPGKIVLTLDDVVIEDFSSTESIAFYGERFRYGDLFVVTGDDRRLAWLFPYIEDPTGFDQIVRNQIWATITAVIVPVLGEWHNDEALAELRPRDAWDD